MDIADQSGEKGEFVFLVKNKVTWQVGNMYLTYRIAVPLCHCV